jgi:hypothetical protein
VLRADVVVGARERRLASTRCGAQRNRIVCLTGLSSGSRRLRVDVASLNKTMVLENDVVFGPSAQPRHFEAGVAAWRKPTSWLERLILPGALDEWPARSKRRTLKTVIELAR